MTDDSAAVFPIMPVAGERGTVGLRSSIPWAMIADHEHQAKLNHQQTLQRLAERGGLSANEAVCVLSDLPWEPIHHTRAREMLDRLVASWGWEDR